MSARKARGLSKLDAAAIIAILSAPPLLAHFPRLELSPTEVAVRARHDPSAATRRNSSALASIMGELRASIGDVIMLKTERYMHSGVAYNAHINAAELASSGQSTEVKPATNAHASHHHGPTTTTATAALDHHDDDSTAPAATPRTPMEQARARAQNRARAEAASTSFENRLVGEGERETATIKPGEIVKEKPGADAHELSTIIKPARLDYRGFIGDLQRQVEPWRDASEGDFHTAGTELLPWYRLGTLADPHNTRLYMVGAWWLRSLGDKAYLEEAAKFVDEGIRNNPESYQLLLMRGYVDRSLGKQRSALKAFTTAAELALKQRPGEGQVPTDQWTEYMEDDAVAAVTLSFLLRRDLDGTEAARQAGEHFKSLAKIEMKPLDRLQRTLPPPPSQPPAKAAASPPAATR